MNIHEYQAKEILRKFSVPTGKGVVALSKDEIDNVIDNFDANLYVVKAQIHAGGRGKGGGVKITKSKEDAKKLAHQMYGMNLVTHQTGPQGQIVKRIYIEDGCDIEKEYYFSAIVDRSSSSVVLMASAEGGVDIEEVAHNTPEKILMVSVDTATGIMPFHCRKIAYFLGFANEKLKDVSNMITSIYNALIATDANQIEINPLVLTQEGKILALDAKINFDENALFRQAEIVKLRDESEEDPLETRAALSSLSYVKMDGEIGCMVNGAGLAMATMDIIKYYGKEPANFLDVGGGADKERVTEALRIILSDQSVKAVLVNIFGGIMKCDIIAEGIIAAAEEIGINVPLVVRLSGTNFELGKEILSKSNLKIIAADDLADAAKKVVASVN